MPLILSVLGKNLEKCKKFFNKKNSELSQAVADDSIKWTTISPRSPYFGGLRESCVKREKFHFSDIIQTKKLTYEEFLTEVIKVEAVLNSRPLTPLSDNPNDLKVLTPFNFLIQDYRTQR